MKKKIFVLCLSSLILTLSLIFNLPAKITKAAGELWNSSGDNIYNTNSDNVGIGTNNPSMKLHVLTGSSSGDGLFLEGQNNLAGVDLAIKNNNTGGRKWIFRSTGGGAGIGQGKLAIKDNYADEFRMIFDTDGDIGIGTSNPQSRLTVLDGDIELREDDDGNSAITLTSGNDAGQFNAYYNGTKTIYLTGNPDGDSYINAGKIGIGTDSPTSKLTVSGNIKANTLKLGSAGATITADASGDICIGDCN